MHSAGHIVRLESGITLKWCHAAGCKANPVCLQYLWRSLSHWVTQSHWLKKLSVLTFCHFLKICYCFYSCFVCDNSTDSQFWKWSHSLSTAPNNIDIWTKNPSKQKLQYELVSSLAVLPLLEFDLVKRSKARNLCILSFQQWVEMALNFSLSKQVNICC